MAHVEPVETFVKVSGRSKLTYYRVRYEGWYSVQNLLSVW